MNNLLRDRIMDMRDRRMGRDGRGYARNARGEFTRHDRGYDERGRDERGYGRDERRDRGYDRGYDRSYGDRRYDDYDSHGDMEYNDCTYLTERELDDWSRSLKNADGTRGAKFSRSEVLEKAKQHGVPFGNEFTEDEFVTTVNMLYSDYCKVMPGADVTMYIRLAMAFLMDEDAAVRGGEKLAMYYCDFVAD